MNMKEDFPFVTKEITFGNLYDGADGQVKYSIWHTSDEIELNFNQLLHLHKVMGEIIESEKKRR